MAGESDKANSHIFDAMVNQKINLADTDTLKKWLSEQTAFDGKKYWLHLKRLKAKRVRLKWKN